MVKTSIFERDGNLIGEGTHGWKVIFRQAFPKDHHQAEGMVFSGDRRIDPGRDAEDVDDPPYTIAAEEIEALRQVNSVMSAAKAGIPLW